VFDGHAAIDLHWASALSRVNELQEHILIVREHAHGRRRSSDLHHAGIEIHA
jgi:hypothetical protein